MYVLGQQLGLQIYALDTPHFTGTQSKHQAFPSRRVGRGKILTSGSFCNRCIKCIFLQQIHNLG